MPPRPPRTSLPQRVGIIGLGVMGGPMTRNLLTAAGQRTAVVINARSQERVSGLLEAGARWAATPRELASQVSVIVLMLPDLPEVEEVLNGPDGILSGINQATVLVISSTSSASGLRTLAERVSSQTHGLLHVVDAPVSGGEEGAIAGTLSIMVGGADEDVKTVWPVLESMGNPAHLGPLGSGAIAKFCNQIVVGATVLALGEASVIAERSGIDLKELFDILGGGYAGSRVLETRKRRFISADYRPSGPARYMLKDLTFATEEAVRTGTDAQQLRTLLNAFQDLTKRGFGDQDIAVTKAYVQSLKP